MNGSPWSGTETLYWQMKMRRALSSAVWESGPPWAHLRHLLLKGNCLMVWKFPSSRSAVFSLCGKTAVFAILLCFSKFARAKTYFMLCIGSTVPWCVGYCGLPSLNCGFCLQLCCCWRSLDHSIAARLGWGLRVRRIQDYLNSAVY